MSQEFEDPRKELLEDLLQWLEWQASCGGEVWPVENIALWNQRLPKTLKPPSRGRRSSTTAQSGFLKSASSEGPKPLDRNRSRAQSKSQVDFKPRLNEELNAELNDGFNNQETVQPKTSRTAKKPKRALAAAFTSFLQARPPSIDFSQIDEKTGLKTIKEPQRQHCSAEKACSIGGGRPGNPVLVIEGHCQGLTLAAKESLGKIMDNVLNIPRNKMYWLPYPIKSSDSQSGIEQSRCSLCPHLFKASLECLSPQIVLVMGADMQQKMSMRNDLGNVQMGIEMEVHTNKWTVPTLWTHHPTDMVGDVRLKKECMTHLKTFKRMLRKITL